MKFRIIFIITLLASMISCSRPQSYHRDVIAAADRLLPVDTDSALSLLDRIDPSELTEDSLRAHYHYLRAWGHMRQNRSLIADSLITFAHGYYRGKDIVRDMRSGTALAFYKFWVGDTQGAISFLDSLIALDNVPDTLIVQTLRVRLLLGASEYQGEEIVPLAKRLDALETDSLRMMEAKYLLCEGYLNEEKMDSALYIIEELVDYAGKHHWGDKHFMLSVEHCQILTELGRYDDSEKMIDYIFTHGGPDNGAADYLHLTRAINALNTGNIALATSELAIADSFAIKFRGKDETYYRSYSNLLKAMIDFKQTGRMKLSHVNGQNNRQRERFNRMQASQWESERGALRQQSRALALKAESEHKTVVILIIGIVALILLAGAAWIIRNRRQRERDNEERIEALQKMVDEYRAAPAVSDPSPTNLPALRRAMIQQLGIIKMVAETPTEQNREMLRKISSIDGETGGELVNWDNVFELIDNLYSDFYTKLHERYGQLLSMKEVQIIVMMVAGFSTKEISVITGQTTSTIYVRKSSIRKKLGVPEKEDIVAFIRTELSH
ncbi:MAG: LuxR C-terminal-related transcriptional regulator [Duncaniella sp.]|nr:LuxR C-terminal-related transcriptional regulator [Duncaniella sp.]